MSIASRAPAPLPLPGGTTLRSHDAYLARKYAPELDGLRALSVLLVLSAHMHDKVWDWLGGWQGVSVFFVLSGYLITALALREEGERGRLSLPAFYVRRSFRIFPLYYLVLGLYCFLILGLRLSPEARALRWALPCYLLYLQEVPDVFGLPADLRAAGGLPFYQSWSLGIEEKFYLVWPLLAFVLWRRGGAARRNGTLLLAACFGLLQPLLCAARALGPGWDGRWLGHLLEPYYRILIGCLLALLLHDRGWFDRLRPLATRGGTAAALGLLLALHFTRPQVAPFAPLRLGCEVFYAAAVAAFLVGVLRGEGLTQRVLRARPLVFIGRLSYGIYLVHLLCLHAAQRAFPPGTGRLGVSLGAFVLTGLVSVAVAWALHLAVERPCIVLGRRWSAWVLGRAGETRSARRDTLPEGPCPGGPDAPLAGGVSPLWRPTARRSPAQGVETGATRAQ